MKAFDNVIKDRSLTHKQKWSNRHEGQVHARISGACFVLILTT